jgi:hypothetical protein
VPGGGLCSQTHSEEEDDMETAVMATQILGNLGLFLGGLGLIWFATLYRDKNK